MSPPRQFPNPESVMKRALELAARGEGRVEPNPMVGAVIVDADLNLLGEGWHEMYGGPHAEIAALRDSNGNARGGTLFVTLEPCCHQGKTGPCTRAIIEAGIVRVVAAISDPAPWVKGKGFAELRAAGIAVETGLLAPEAAALAAPFEKLVTRGLPWVHAKWAMTLDGKIATRTGDSRWISNETSRARVHQLRGRMDAIIVGAGTVRADDPQLTARPSGPRTPLRIVCDRQASISLESRLVKTARDVPVLVVAESSAPSENIARLQSAGVEVLRLPAGSDLPGELLKELGRRKMTNVLVEGGGTLLGSFFDAEQIDEVHLFIAPRLVGGATAPGPIAGIGRERIVNCPRITAPHIETCDGDVYVRGRLDRESTGDSPQA